MRRLIMEFPIGSYSSLSCNLVGGVIIRSNSKRYQPDSDHSTKVWSNWASSSRQEYSPNELIFHSPTLTKFCWGSGLGMRFGSYNSEGPTKWPLFQGLVPNWTSYILGQDFYEFHIGIDVKLTLVVVPTWLVDWIIRLNSERHISSDL